MSSPKPTDYVGNMWNDFRRGNFATEQATLIERFYMRYLTELACNRFIWKGLPSADEPDGPLGDCRPRYMELTLFRYALVVFFQHKAWDNRFLALRAAQNGPMDIYFDPTAFHMIGNGTSPKIDGHTVSGKDAIPIWANYLRAPDMDLVSIYVRRMAKFDRTVEINLDAMRHPFVMAADQSTKASVMEFYRQVDQGQPVIWVQGALADSMEKFVKVLDMEIDSDLITNLLIDKKKVWQECLTFLGINNGNQDKRERLVQAEVSANDSEVLAARAIALDARQQACDRINKKWPELDVSVEWNTKVDAMGDMPGMAIGNAGVAEIKSGEGKVSTPGVKSTGE